MKRRILSAQYVIDEVTVLYELDKMYPEIQAVKLEQTELLSIDIKVLYLATVTFSMTFQALGSIKLYGPLFQR